MRAAAILLVSVVAAPCSAIVLDSDLNANPIRRVVNMLQSMAKRVEKEGEEEQKLFDKFMCYCKTSSEKLTKQIAEEEAQVPQLQSDIDGSEATLKSAQQQLQDSTQSRAAAQQAVAEAKQTRAGDHDKYVAESSEQKGYMDVLDQAIPAIEKGSGALVQTSTGAKLRQAITMATSITDYDRNLLVSAITGSSEDGEEYTPRTGEVTGILKTMRESFAKAYNEAEEEEAGAAQVHDELMTAKSKELRTLENAIEKKTSEIGDLKVHIVKVKADLADIQSGLSKDYELAKSLKEECDAKPKEWDARKEGRQEELKTIYETVKILNDDDALDLFKKTLPSASFLQLENKQIAIAHSAAKVIQNLPAELRKQLPQLDFLSLALTGKNTDFTQVQRMIDNMVKLLKKEQTTDYHKKDACRDQLNAAKDKQRQLKADISDLEQGISQRKENIVNMKDAIRATKNGIQDLDKSVAAATQQRKEDHQEYLSSLALNNAAKDLLSVAETRLNKYYNPGLYKQTLTTTPAADDFSFLQQSDEPEAFEAYRKKNSDNTGVLSMLNNLVSDLQKQNAEAEVEENNAQKEYEKIMQNAQAKRAADLRYISSQEGAVADEEDGKAIAEQKERKEMKILEEERKLLAATHSDCDFLMQNFDLRKKARTDEIDALSQAKTVLAGADFSFVQARGATGRNLRGH